MNVNYDTNDQNMSKLISDLPESTDLSTEDAGELRQP